MINITSSQPTGTLNYLFKILLGQWLRSKDYLVSNCFLLHEGMNTDDRAGAFDIFSPSLFENFTNADDRARAADILIHRPDANEGFRPRWMDESKTLDPDSV